MTKQIEQKGKIAKRYLEGEVVGTTENKTVRVLVREIKMHPKYRKQYTVTRKYAVHDENGQAKKGNLVLFVECRPISKTKKWRLVKVMNKPENI